MSASSAAALDARSSSWGWPSPLQSNVTIPLSETLTVRAGLSHAVAMLRLVEARPSTAGSRGTLVEGVTARMWRRPDPRSTVLCRLTSELLTGVRRLVAPGRSSVADAFTLASGLARRGCAGGQRLVCCGRVAVKPSWLQLGLRGWLSPARSAALDPARFKSQLPGTEGGGS